MWRCEIATTSTGGTGGAGCRRRRCASDLVSAGSVRTRTPAISTSTVECPIHVIVIGVRAGSLTVASYGASLRGWRT